MKFNYQFEEGNESDCEFLDEQISTSFMFDRTEKVQLVNLKKWLSYMNIAHAVTRVRDESGKKNYCVVIYEGDRTESNSVKETKKEVPKEEIVEEVVEEVVDELYNDSVSALDEIVEVVKSSKSKKKSKKKAFVA